MSGMFSLSALRPLRAELRQNRRDHADEVRYSRLELGYAPSQGLRPRAVPEVESWALPQGTSHLGLGAACPFASGPLVFATRQPLCPPAVCRAVRREAAAHMASGGSSSFTMTDTNRDADVHSLPRTQRWLNAALAARIFPLAARCFGAAVAPHSELFVYRALVVQYDAAARLTHQPTHRDGALVSLIVPLNAPDEYAGGGTELEALDEALVLPQGRALLHPSSLRHAARRIRGGERWVLVVFLGHARMRFAEHGRRLKARAAEQGDGEAGLLAELRLLQHALVVCADDSELWYDAGACLHDLGRLGEAAQHYARSLELNPADPNPHTNLGALLLEAAQPRAAFSCFRRALTLDPQGANAWANAASVLLELDKPRALRTLLASAPPSVRRDPGVASMLQAVGKLGSV